ncbi:hypothetical protein ACLBWZ_14110 [Brucellaceae bacterium C25G]
MENLRYKVFGPQITWEEFDNEYVVLDLDSGRYFNFSGGAAIVWRGVLAGYSPDAFSLALADDKDALTAFQRFFTDLNTNGLITLDDIEAIKPENLTEEIAAAGRDFNFESFDDLAALLVADPIHDVETEAGWPHRQDT